MDTSVIEQFVLLTVIGAVVAIVAHRLHIPYTVGLVVAGLVMAVLPIRIDLPFNKDFLFEVLLTCSWLVRMQSSASSCRYS
jgi:Kef-type K+ transport system membrane component KefB